MCACTHTHTGILFSHEKGGYPAIWISLEHISLSKIKLWIYTRDRNESGKKETWGKLNIKVVRLGIDDMMTHEELNLRSRPRQ